MTAWDTPVRGRTPRDRFECKYVEREDGCWEWQANRTQDGYGLFWLEGRMWVAHRVSYLMNVGPIPDGLELDHHTLPGGDR